MGMCVDCSDVLCEVCASMKKHPAGKSVVTDVSWALATAQRLGAEAEQERIIKLLEELDDEEWMGINQNFIALIKGENK